MRETLHVVPSDELPYFVQAYMARNASSQMRVIESLLVQAGICQEAEAKARLTEMQRRVLGALAENGPSTVREISQAVPELNARVRHSVGKPYEGEFSIGSRLIPSMCALGLIVRGRPRGTWRSNLHTYVALSDWLPDVDLDSVAPQEARAWLVWRYLSTFGPATFDDVQWWTGFSKGETQQALKTCQPSLIETRIAGSGDVHLLLKNDFQQLSEHIPPEAAWVIFLPGLDPYIMGYRDRSRFLAPEHVTKVFDRAGNAMPTVWVDGRVVGAWGQRKDGCVAYGLFESVGPKGQRVLADEISRLESFLDGEYIPSRSHTPFTRALV
jgi:hypothetical protein